MESDDEEVKEQALGWGSAWMVVGKEGVNADACEYSVTTVEEGWMEQCGVNGIALEGLLPLLHAFDHDCPWSKDYWEMCMGR